MTRSNIQQDIFQPPTAERLDCLGAGCYVQIHRQGECQWLEISRTEGDELVGVLHPALSTPLSAESTADTAAEPKELRLRREQITALGCERYCSC